MKSVWVRGEESFEDQFTLGPFAVILVVEVRHENVHDTSGSCIVDICQVAEALRGSRLLCGLIRLSKVQRAARWEV